MAATPITGAAINAAGLNRIAALLSCTADFSPRAAAAELIRVHLGSGSGRSPDERSEIRD
jgi:hypothetical protein